MMITPFLPKRPGDVPADLSMVELFTHHAEHLAHVAATRDHLSDPTSAAETFEHARAALAIEAEAISRLFAERWNTVHVALLADASRGQQVAEACDLTAPELALGLSRWADEQTEIGAITTQERRVVDLLVRDLSRP